MSATAKRRATTTGGRDATTRHIPPKLALAVGMPKTPAPKNWSWTALTKLARMESGHTPSRRHPEYWDGSVPWIGIKDARINHGSRIEETLQKTNALGLANSSARLLPENTVCLSRTASVGYVVIMGRPMATSQDFVNWVCDVGLDPEFLKYLFIAEDDDILRFASGSVHQTIYFPEAKAFHICHPPLPEQRRIVGILDEAFAGIATAKANAEKNLQNARALFESHLNAVFAERGDGWASATVGELVEQKLLAKPLDGNHGEIHPKKSDFVKSGVPFIMAAHLSNGAVDQERCYFITRKQANSLRKGFAKDGDVLLSHKGTIGRVAVLETSHDFVVLTPQVTFYRVLDDTALHNRYLYFFFQSPKFQDELNGIAGGGSTRAYIGITKQQELRIGYPRLDDQLQIASTLEKIVRETQRLESIYQRKLAALDELKKSLLHQAFSGQL